MRRSTGSLMRTACVLAASAALVAGAASAGAAPAQRGAAPAAQASPRVAKSQQLAVLNHDTAALRKPQLGAAVAGEVNEVRPISGERTVLPVVATTTAHGAKWLQVLLPGRPNSHTGWIEAAAVSQTSTEWRIVVDLAARKVSVYYDGALTRTFSAVVGKPSTPTPTGSFFVEETVPLAADIAGTPFALALSARSDALAEFEGGPGQIALHGITNIGGVPGTAVSHGCVRLETADITWLGAHISSGVPVTITN
jgi:lipoprotein-anchoring transpeptidase ErfK/SrfK